ncbi:MAG TPA: hypothetical protein VIV35_02065 [Chitinophagaceae bacterium]
MKKILNKLNGLHFPQEYLCLAQESFEQPLHAYLIHEGQVIKDITKLHSFVGYSPLIFSLSSPANDPVQSSTIDIAFTQHEWHLNGSFRQKDAIALLRLKKIKEQKAGNETILYYEGVKGSHRFISAFHQFIIQFYNRLYHKKPGNVFLPGNLYKQVQIAYSIPRNICLITVGQNDLFNLFPTDLHGPVNEDHYIISLRHDGKACRQVTTTGRILLSDVHSNFYKTAYALGKNHMQEMKVKKNYPFADRVSAHLQLPLPQLALFYRELELRDSFIHGIHRVMLFKTLYRQRFQDTPSTLVHIHNAYATWRQNNRLPGNYLLR